MWRSVFIALGVMAIVLGLEFLVIDSATFYDPDEVRTISFLDPTGSSAEAAKVFRPKDWMPWAFLSGGIVTIVYSYLIPVRYRSWRQAGAG
ncbi:hypothetical protein [Novipirellula artificiosorum]|uniref:Uncharacterized protein n=1 Tax=Novipirellula artificiosorum TaxID=2528016 RepID=A0A5C6DEJ6_9BACT|nr:hypothetical protein [Novipirellula artificiosorum]TWU33349.1 hypothetical protein Poly41_51030 [Novipirellula artificiosorum]